MHTQKIKQALLGRSILVSELVVMTSEHLDDVIAIAVLYRLCPNNFVNKRSANMGSAVIMLLGLIVRIPRLGCLSWKCQQ